MLTIEDIAKAVAAHPSIHVAVDASGLGATLTYSDAVVYAARTSADTEALRAVAGHVLVSAEQSQPNAYGAAPSHVVALRFAVAPPPKPDKPKSSDPKSKDA